MRKTHALLVHLTFIPMLFLIIQLAECAPTYFQEYRKKQQKIREVRLKKSAAEERLKNLQRKYNRRKRSIINARNSDVHIEHSNRQKWTKKDRTQVELNANIKRHRLLARVLDNSEISEPLLHRANSLQNKSDELQKQKDNLKQTGTHGLDYYARNLLDERMRYNKFNDKKERCEKSIKKHSEYLSKNRCTIL